MLNLDFSFFSILNRAGNKLIQKTGVTKSDIEFNKSQIAGESKSRNLKSAKKDSLNKCIRNLQYINHLEMSFDEKYLKNTSLEFLRSIEELKHKTQSSILEITNNLNKKT